MSIRGSSRHFFIVLMKLHNIVYPFCPDIKYESTFAIDQLDIDIAKHAFILFANNRKQSCRLQNYY